MRKTTPLLPPKNRQVKANSAKQEKPISRRQPRQHTEKVTPVAQMRPSQGAEALDWG